MPLNTSKLTHTHLLLSLSLVSFNVYINTFSLSLSLSLSLSPSLSLSYVYFHFFSSSNFTFLSFPNLSFHFSFWVFFSAPIRDTSINPWNSLAIVRHTQFSFCIFLSLLIRIQWNGPQICFYIVSLWIWLPW